MCTCTYEVRPANAGGPSAGYAGAADDWEVLEPAGGVAVLVAGYFFVVSHESPKSASAAVQLPEGLQTRGTFF